MNLSTRERQWLAEIERRLIADEPRLHRALSRLSSRPLGVPRTPSVVLGAVLGPRVRRWLGVAVLTLGLVLLLVGALTGLVAVLFTGVGLAQLGPLLAHCLASRRGKARVAHPRGPSTPAGSRP